MSDWHDNLKKIQKETQSIADGDPVWVALSTSLQHIASQLEAWGDLMASASQRPTPETIREIVGAIDELDRELRALDRWLSNRISPRWAALGAQLQEARSAWRKSGGRGDTSSYLQWRETQPADVVEPRDKANLRAEAGDSIIDLAANLSNAVTTAARVQL